MVEIGLVVLEIQKAEFGNFMVPVNNILVCLASSFVFLAADTLLCVLILYKCVYVKCVYVCACSICVYVYRYVFVYMYVCACMHVYMCYIYSIKPGTRIVFNL